ncbi:MAG TPA: beta-CASP ribonuclease aCPSF1 [Euryarchaeota archaeon]|nr:beta-CASP ribonuclease aCPSF1 [Euryarchaeota archaeon]
MEKELLKKIVEIVGEEAGVTKVEPEGPELGVYTRNPMYFLENENAVASIAAALKKRVSIRSDPSILAPPEHAKDVILATVPEEAGITDIQFVPEMGTAYIEAKKPGLVIGKGGETLKKIVGQTGWLPNVCRAPAMESNILKGVRKILIKHVKERKKFYKKVYVRINRPKSTDKEWVRVHFLGASRFVGRSAQLVETPESKILVDAGVDISGNGPMFPELEALRMPLDEIDAVVITHAHLDHSGMVPYLLKLGYDGPIYATPPTRDLSALLQFDFVDVLTKDGVEAPYSERWVKEAAIKTITRNYGEVTDIAPDIRITFHNAGHILGSATVHMHIGQGFHNIVFTGDIKYGFSWLHNPADTKYPRVDTVVIESTYGARDDVHPPRKETEAMLEKLLRETMEKGGKLLIPAFAVGRAQEIMLTLEAMYRKNDYDWPIYVDGMMKEASAIYTAYPEYLKKDVQRRILSSDSPFEMEHFVYVDSYAKRDEIIEGGPAVIIAPSGSLTGGPAVDYFQRIAEDEKNAIALVGYQFEMSLGRKLQKGIKEIPMKVNGGKMKAIHVAAKVETLHGFSGHSDRRQLEAFVRHLPQRPSRILTVHGEEEKCVALARDLGRSLRVESYAPRLLDVLRLR